MVRLFVAVPLLLALQSCDLTGGPAIMQRQIEAQLRQYFPHRRAIVSPTQGTIFALTCTRGLGKPVIEELVKHLEGNRGVQRLNKARHFPLKLSPYRLLVLEFDDYVVRLDADTGASSVLQSDSESRLRYNRLCEAEAASQLAF